MRPPNTGFLVALFISLVGPCGLAQNEAVDDWGARLRNNVTSWIELPLVTVLNETQLRFISSHSQESNWLITFEAPWCGRPCIAVRHILQMVAERLVDSVRVGRINVHEFQSLKTEYKISRFPTIILFRRDGSVSTFPASEWRTVENLAHFAKTSPSPIFWKAVSVSAILITMLTTDVNPWVAFSKLAVLCTLALIATTYTDNDMFWHFDIEMKSVATQRFLLLALSLGLLGCSIISRNIFRTLSFPITRASKLRLTCICEATVWGVATLILLQKVSLSVIAAIFVSILFFMKADVKSPAHMA